MDIYGEYLQLARLAVSGRKEDISMLLRRALRRSEKDRPEFQAQLKNLMSHTENIESPQRKVNLNKKNNEKSISSSFLKSQENDKTITPIWTPAIEHTLLGILDERKKIKALKSVNINPTSTLLFIGPPGVGKSLAAKWIAESLNKKLLVLDLASIMSSYLGKTGLNLRNVIEEAAQSDAVLFLDEFDSIAKKRDDQSDIGELKRLVNVLLQALDDWPNNGLLIAATNHSELLDSAVWRRFDDVVKFNLPAKKEIKSLTKNVLKRSHFKVDQKILDILSIALEGISFSDIEHWLTRSMRTAIIKDLPIEAVIIEKISFETRTYEKSQKKELAKLLLETGVSQRKASEALGLSRDTIRKYIAKQSTEEL